MKAFTMTFFAEWDDRSQIATIALVASFEAFFVTIGAPTSPYDLHRRGSAVGAVN